MIKINLTKPQCYYSPDFDRCHGKVWGLRFISCLGYVTLQLHCYNSRLYNSRLNNSKTLQPQDFTTPRLFNPKTLQPQIFTTPDLTTPRLYNPRTFQLQDFTTPRLYNSRCYNPSFYDLRFWHKLIFKLISKCNS